MDAGPVFLLAGGGRTGSTLVQRLVVSTGQVLMWGEHRGAIIEHLLAMTKSLGSWLAYQGRFDWARFRLEGYFAWIPNLNPELPCFFSASREFLEHSLGHTARQMGYPRWRFKEIRYGREEALFLHRLYPDTRFVILIRNPADRQRSIKSTRWYQEQYDGNPTVFLRDWARLTAELTEIQPQLPHSLVLRYEDLISEPDACLRRRASVIAVDAARFDRSVVGRVERGSVLPLAPLDPADWQALQCDEIRSIANRVGYHYDAEPS
jgi:hypothetical protein